MTLVASRAIDIHAGKRPCKAWQQINALLISWHFLFNTNLLLCHFTNSVLSLHNGDTCELKLFGN